MGEPSGASVRGGLSLFCWMEPRRVRAVRGPMASGYAVWHVVDRPLLKAARSLQTRSARPCTRVSRGALGLRAGAESQCKAVRAPRRAPGPVTRRFGTWQTPAATEGGPAPQESQCKAVRVSRRALGLRSLVRQLLLGDLQHRAVTMTQFSALRAARRAFERGAVVGGWRGRYSRGSATTSQR